MKREQSPARSFEDDMTELEQLVARLESGNLSLEESLTTFERGVGLVRALNDRLNTAEARIEQLTREPTGNLHLEPFATEPTDGK
jgi:exodeoxyribonuclease VII small subunit